jgi:adenosylcobyric acid synthase
MREQGWDKELLRHLRFGGKVIGICGGYQMLGKTISDPTGIEGQVGESIGLGLLDVYTELKNTKQLTNVHGTLTLNNSTYSVKGYEIHVGSSVVSNKVQPVKLSTGQSDGALSDCGQVLGTYLHGFFDNPDILNAVVEWSNGQSVSNFSVLDEKEHAIDRIADAIEQHLDLEKLWSLKV